MGFETGITGLGAATVQLDVIGNNIANVGTTGFKESLTSFSDIYTASGGSNTIGAGVSVSTVRQVHSQGNIQFTNNSLDLAVSGNGYFVLEGGNYTRSGAFSLDTQGFIVNFEGSNLQGLNIQPDGKLGQVTENLQIDTSSSAPRATEAISIGVNLDARSDVTAGVAFDINNGNTFNNLSSTTVYDSLGNAHVLTSHYRKTANDNEWEVYFGLNGNDLSQSATVNFEQNGSISNTFTPINITSTLTNGADDLDFSLNLNDTGLGASTQFGSDYNVQVAYQDGYSTGRIEGLEVDNDGVILGRFSNGQSRTLGRVQLANFRNPEGLRPVGSTGWVESSSSGAPSISAANTGSLGSISSGALEQSTVDLTAELVSLITAQRNFQANAQTIRTASELSQTIINLR